MIIDCISDLHGFFPELTGGDLLIIAGDLTARDEHEQYTAFNRWVNNQSYDLKIVISGNHDGRMVTTDERHLAHVYCHNAMYLCDSGCEFQGLKIWGSPWTPTFCNWHFMKDRGEQIRKMWDLIPSDVDILITHGPPYGILDKVDLSSRGNKFKYAGCEELRNKLDSGAIKPKLHVFGHIHACGGKQMILKTPGHDILCVNAAIMDEEYRPTNQPVRVVL